MNDSHSDPLPTGDPQPDAVPQPPAPPRPRVVCWSHTIIGGVYFVIATAIMGLTWILPVGESKLYPRCTFKQATGLDCSGCGSTRAVSALAHGQIGQAFAYNALLMLTLPILSWWFLHCLVYGISGRRLWPRDIGVKWIWLLPVLIILFSVIRNLPWFPFTLLAPHAL